MVGGGSGNGMRGNQENSGPKIINFKDKDGQNINEKTLTVNQIDK